MKGERKPFDFEESLRVALRVGISLKDWEWMTPRELFLYIQEFNERLKMQQELAIIQAYYTAAFYRARRLQNLETILRKFREMNKPQKAQTPEEMLAFAKAYMAALKERKG